MANDFAYIIKAIDEFTEPTNGVIRSVDNLNSHIKTSNNLMSSQNSVLKKNKPLIGDLNNLYYSTGSTVKKASESASLFSLSLGKIATVAAVYKGWEFSKELMRVQNTIQGLNASFGAILPKFGLTGTKTQLAADEMAWLKKTTDELGVSFEASAKPYARFLASSNMGIKSSREVFKSFAGFANLFGLTGEDFAGIIKALEQMQSKTTITAEELKGQLGDRMPMAVKLFADAAGVSVPKFLKLMQDGQVGANLMAKVADEITKRYSKDIEKSSKTLLGNANRTSNAIFFMKEAVGTAFKPAMDSVVTATGTAANSIGNLFLAMEDKQTFNNMSDGMKTIITALKIAGGLAEGFFKALSGIKELGGYAVDLIGMPLTAGKSIGRKIGDIGLDREAARYKETMENIRQQQLSRRSAKEVILMDRRQSAESKANVTIDFKNVPKGASIFMDKDPASTLLNLGANISYGGSY